MTRNRTEPMRALLVCAFVIVSNLSLLAKDPPASTIRIYVFTATAPKDGSFSPPDLSDREAAVQDIQNNLTYRSGKATFSTKDLTAVVKDRAGSDLAIEVLRLKRDPNNGDMRSIDVRLTAGDYSAEISGFDNDGSWRKAAADTCLLVRKWIIKNQELLMQRRQSERK